MPYPDITPEQMPAYRATAQRRYQQQCDHLRARQQRGLVIAQQAAHLLRGSFAAQRVVLFGSLVSPHRFHERSDIDLAAWGIPERDYYRAVG